MAKVMISMPDELLEVADDAARRRGTTRSGYIQDLVQKDRDEPAFDVEQVLRELDLIRSKVRGGPYDTTAMVREDRDHGH